MSQSHTIQGKVLYDFEGVSENGELTIRQGQIITILNQDVGDGWWEAQLPNGESGLFPEAYVELVESGDTENQTQGCNDMPANTGKQSHTKQAKVLYDFEGKSENAELTMHEGQIVNILNMDVGDGWWEGELPNGQIGLFPEAYVEEITQ